jgi:hypothetical protein
MPPAWVALIWGRLGFGCCTAGKVKECGEDIRVKNVDYISLSVTYWLIKIVKKKKKKKKLFDLN